MIDKIAKALRDLIIILVQKPYRKNIDFLVSRNRDNHIKIKITVKHGPFSEWIEDEERIYVNDCAVTETELQNLIMHAITFSGSPFYLTKQGFSKNMQVYG